MKCPVCVDVDLSISSREGVEIDFCPQCRGVWLDRGELDKVIDRAAASQPAVPVAAPAYDDRGPARSRGGHDEREWRSEKEYKKRKRRSFLDDLFDFD